MTETRGMVRIEPEEAPEGLREALEASWRLLLRAHRVKILPAIWEWDGRYLVRVEVDGEEEMWQWTPGEPVFVREGGV